MTLESQESGQRPAGSQEKDQFGCYGQAYAGHHGYSRAARLCRAHRHAGASGRGRADPGPDAGDRRLRHRPGDYWRRVRVRAAGPGPPHHRARIAGPGG